MAILLECASIIIPISKLKKSNKIPDVNEFLREQRNDFSGCWFDRYLFRYPGGMGGTAVMSYLDFMKSQGFMLTRKYNGVMHWQDVCVVDAGGPTMPCRWLDYDPDQGIVWYKGTEPGKVVATGSDSELYVLGSLLQEKLFEIIHTLANIPNIFEYGNDVLYGLKNYIARHSLASAQYNMTKEAESLLIDDRFRSFDDYFARRSIDKKRFIYEHPIPASVVCRLIKDSDRSIDAVKEILSLADCVTVITKQQDKLLTSQLSSKMPDGWFSIGGDRYSRYKEVGIELSSVKLKVKGALVR